MAGSLSDYMLAKVLDLVFGNTALTVPGPLYMALLTDQNTVTQRNAGTVTEVSGGSYARVSVAQNSTNWLPASGAPPVKQNGAVFTFPAPTANWGTVYAFAVYDASTAGRLIYWCDLLTPHTINNGDGAPSIPT